MTKLKNTIIILALTFFLLPNASVAQVKQSIKEDSSNDIPDTLLFKIQKAQAAVTEINSANKKGYGYERILTDLNVLKSNITPIKNDLNTDKKVIDKKSLLSYDLIIKDALAKLGDWQVALSKYNNDLQQRSKEVINLSKDSLLQVNQVDSAAKKLYVPQLNDIRLRLQNAGKITAANLDTVSKLLADVSAFYAIVTDLQTNTYDRLLESGQNEISKESPYIWAAPNKSSVTDVNGLIRSSFQGQNKVLKYFINSTWDNRVLLLLLVTVFFLWITSNYKKASRPELSETIGTLNFTYLKPYPLLTSLIVLLNLTPIFEPNSPSLYIELNHFLLLVVLTLQFGKHLPLRSYLNWLIIAGLYIVIICISALVHDAFWMRFCLIVLNLASLYLGTVFYRKMQEADFPIKFIKPVLIFYLVFNVLSVIFNVFGRISLAKVFSVTAIIGLTQVIGLAIFIQILTDALELQIKVSSASGGLFARFNVSKARISFKKILSLVAIVLWILVFLINLSIAGGVFVLLEQLLVKTRHFGSINFTLSNILFFAIIVYLANILQKHVGLLFGESSLTFEEKTEHKSSKLALIRLLIIILGVLLAVTASGIPLDKLTVMIGALGVGIGLGLQNIITNFVSGIILIFEKPFRIGDYVELADKKGKVQDIGIRSSKMLTAQGSEVFIPNGDLLSGRLINWTLTNDYVKTEISFKIGIESDLEATYKIIEEEIKKAHHTVNNLPPEILLNAISADAIELKVLVWISNVYIEATFKSDVLRALLLRFKASSVRIL